MLEDSFEVCLLAVCWFMGMECSLAIYVKVFEYGYKAIAKSMKECLIFAVLGVVFGSYVNVIAKQISVKFGNYSDYLTVLFYLIVIGFYLFALFKSLNFEETKNIKYSVAIKSLIFVVFVMSLRLGCMKIMTMIAEQKGNVPNVWFMENVVWCFLIERLILIIEKKTHELKINGVAMKNMGEDN